MTPAPALDLTTSLRGEFWAPKKGRNRSVTPAISGIPHKGGYTLLKTALALPSRESKEGRKCYVTLALWRVPS